jgi:hypothetical protein
MYLASDEFALLTGALASSRCLSGLAGFALAISFSFCSGSLGAAGSFSVGMSFLSVSVFAAAGLSNS